MGYISLPQSALRPTAPSSEEALGGGCGTAGEKRKGEEWMLYATVRQRKIYIKNPVTVIRNGVGVDQVVLDMDDEWKEMTSIVCVFQNGGITKEKLHTFGQVLEVPWECLAETGRLMLSCTGYVGSEKVMTTMYPDSFWEVVQNGPVTGDTVMEPTPTLYEQVLAAASAARETAVQLMADKENGVFDGDSVTVTGVLETEESGGENIVTFSDGRELRVRNGRDGTGTPGAAGRGVRFMAYDGTADKWTVAYTDGTVEELEGPACMSRTGGRFTGAVFAVSGVDAEAQLRNTALVPTETYPTVNGQINWQYA